MLRILPRYVQNQLLQTLALALTVISLILLIAISFQWLRQAEIIGIASFLEVLPALFVFVLAFSLPIGILAAASLTFGRLAADNEINAARASGVHLFPLLRPGLLISVVLGIGTYFLYGEFIPRAAGKQIEVLQKLVPAMALNFQEAESAVLMVNDLRVVHMGVQRGIVQKLVIQRLQDGRVAEQIMANQAVVSFPAPEVTAFVLTDATVLKFPESGDAVPAKLTTRELYFQVDIPHPRNKRRRLATVTSPELRARLAELDPLLASMRNSTRHPPAAPDAAWNQHLQLYQDYRKEYRQTETELQKRYAFCGAVLLFYWMGAMMGILVRHHNKLIAFGAGAIPILLLYYPLLMLAEAKANKGFWPPWPSLWLADLVVAGLALVLTVRLFRK